jgi:hypothetical protein
MVIIKQSLCAVTTSLLFAIAPPCHAQNVVLSGKKTDKMVDRRSAKNEKN